MSTWIPLLLADPSPSLRWLVLRELLHLPEDDLEVLELQSLRLEDPLVKDILTLQEADGGWSSGFDQAVSGVDRMRATYYALTRLGYLGFNRSLPAVQRGAEYLFSFQREDGAFPMPGNTEAEVEWGKTRYDAIPLQTAFPLRSLALCGYAEDPRAERAYDWLLAQRLEDGAFPVGTSNGVYGYIAGYRRLAHSRWGCRNNTTGALHCLALHPQRRNSPEARRALDLLLGRETREVQAVGCEVARMIGAEPLHGFISYFARFDNALILDLCSRVGLSLDDPRVADIASFLKGMQGAYGLWEYPARPQVSRWLTFDLLRSFSRLNQAGSWLSLEPRTPFQPYPAKRKRY